jgi:hypothetical protein
MGQRYLLYNNLSMTLGGVDLNWFSWTGADFSADEADFHQPVDRHDDLGLHTAGHSFGQNISKTIQKAISPIASL